MFGRLRRGGAVAAVMAMALALWGVAPALAEDEVVYTTSEAMITKVIVGPEGTDASGDTYTFSFLGSGTVREGDVDAGEVRDALYTGEGSDSVQQDSRTIKKDDVVPAIANVTMSGVQLTSANSLTNGQSYQTVVSVPLSEALDAVVFPHAGIYTYRVVESATTTQLTGDGYYINPSKSAYLLRVRVENDDSTPENAAAGKTRVGDVTVERVLDDDGHESTVKKVDPTYPRSEGGKITHVNANTVPAENSLAGDNPERGRDVYGFTFANEYVKGGEFVVKKLVDGDYADKTKLFPIKLEVYSEATTAPDAQGACITYQIQGGGVDNTDNYDEYGDHKTLTGIFDIPQATDNMAVFDAETGIATIDAELKEGSSIVITGVFGPHHASFIGPNGKDKRMVLSTSGLLQGNTYTVTESTPGNYVPTGYVYVGEDELDPRDADALAAAGTSVTQKDKSADGTLTVEGGATGSATTVFVVNTLEDEKVSPTGILIDNLPYILMVVVPLGVFAAMFVSRRRGSALS